MSNALVRRARRRLGCATMCCAIRRRRGHTRLRIDARNNGNAPMTFPAGARVLEGVCLQQCDKPSDAPRFAALLDVVPAPTMEFNPHALTPAPPPAPPQVEVAAPEA